MEPEFGRRKSFRSFFTWWTVTLSLGPAGVFVGTGVLRPTVETQMGRYWQGKIEVPGEKSVPAPLFRRFLI